MKAKPVQIPLTKGKFAIVNASDAKRISKHKWHAKKDPSGENLFYAVRTDRSNGKQRTVRMHRLIIGAKPGQHVDHVDGDGLNNTRRNLRIVTRSQNQFNRHSISSNTGFLGVSKRADTCKKRYQTSMRCKNKRVFCKRFDNKYQAAAMYDHVKRGIAGEFGSYNFDGLLSVNQMRNLIYKSKGIFSVTFRKKTDDAIRILTARLGVSKNLKGGKLAFDPHKKRLVTVFDMSKQKYRLIPIDGILALKINGKYYGTRPIL